MTFLYLVSVPIYKLSMGDQLHDENGQYLGRVDWILSAGHGSFIKVKLDSGLVLELPARDEIAVAKAA